MGKTTYNKIKEFLENYKKGDEIGFMTLQRDIMANVGADPRTVSNTIKVMMDCKLIKDIGNCHFKIL